MSCSNVPRWYGPSAAVRWTGSWFHRLRSIFSPSRSWPPPPARPGTKEASSHSADKPIPTVISQGTRSTRWSACWLMVLPPSGGGDWPISITTESTIGSKAGVGRVSRRSPPAGRFLIRQTMRWWRNRTAPSSGQWTRTSPWKVWPATSCCSAIRPGVSKAWSRARCGWKMLMVPRPAFRFGSVKPPPAQ